jgi:hypothetical protein
MKKLSIIIAAGSLAIATPVFACPGHDSASPKTAEKAPAKDSKGTTATNDKAKEAPKAAPAKETPKDTAKATPSKDTTKKPDKVSQK